MPWFPCGPACDSVKAGDRVEVTMKGTVWFVHGDRIVVRFPGGYAEHFKPHEVRYDTGHARRLGKLCRALDNEFNRKLAEKAAERCRYERGPCWCGCHVTEESV